MAFVTPVVEHWLEWEIVQCGIDPTTHHTISGHYISLPCTQPTPKNTNIITSCLIVCLFVCLFGLVWFGLVCFVLFCICICLLLFCVWVFWGVDDGFFVSYFNLFVSFWVFYQWSTVLHINIFKPTNYYIVNVFRRLSVLVYLRCV